MRSWPLGAVRMTERFLPGERPRASSSRRCARTSPSELAEADWLERGGRLVGVGGTVRNLASAAEIAAELPSYGVQGFAITRDALDELVEQLAELPASERAAVPGIKAARGDLILAGAVVVQCVMEAGGFEALEVTEAGLREGVFYETLLDGLDPPLFEDVRRASVLNLACAYGADFAHIDHVARLALELWDALGRARPARLRPARARPAVVGGDAARHRHGRRLRRPPQALALPDPQRRPARLHPARDRPDRPDRPLPPQGLARASASSPRSRATATRSCVERCAAVLRLAEQLERPRDQTVEGVAVDVGRRRASRCGCEHSEDVTVARWAAERERDAVRAGARARAR